jgi:hypothetical protein
MRGEKEEVVEDTEGSRGVSGVVVKGDDDNEEEEEREGGEKKRGGGFGYRNCLSKFSLNPNPRQILSQKLGIDSINQSSVPFSSNLKVINDVDDFTFI